jgi:tetratricopeptide (TPR) repeat protein
MPDYAAILQRQTEKVGELSALLETEPTPSLFQALSSVYRDRSATHRALGDTDRAIDDLKTGTAMLSQLVLFAGRTDLVDDMVGAGETLRAMLVEDGRDEEAMSHGIGEAQVLVRTGAVERGLAGLRHLAADARTAFDEEPTEDRLYALDETRLYLWAMLREAEKHPEALEVAEETLVLLGSVEPTPHRELCRARRNRAITLRQLGRREEALAELGAVAGEYEANLGPDADPEMVVEAAQAFRARAELLIETQKPEEGLAAFERAFDVVEPHADEDEECDGTLHELYGAAVGAARGLRLLGPAIRFAERRCRRLQRDVERSDSLEAGLELLEGLYHLALLYFEAGRYDVVLDDANKLVATWEQLAAARGNAPQFQHLVLQGLDLREHALVALGRHEEAVADQTRVIDGFRSLLDQGAPPHLLQGLAITLQRRAESLAAIGRHADALADRAEAGRVEAKLQSLAEQ